MTKIQGISEDHMLFIAEFFTQIIPRFVDTHAVREVLDGMDVSSEQAVCIADQIKQQLDKES